MTMTWKIEYIKGGTHEIVTARPPYVSPGGALVFYGEGKKPVVTEVIGPTVYVRAWEDGK